jgi:hypothetical protein
MAAKLAETIPVPDKQMLRIYSIAQKTDMAIEDLPTPR